MDESFEIRYRGDLDDIPERMTREEFEAGWWLITRWIQDIQRENGEPVIPDELIEKRIQQKVDELFGQAEPTPEKELLALFERVDHMSQMLSEEVSGLLTDAP